MSWALLDCLAYLDTRVRQVILVPPASRVNLVSAEMTAAPGSKAILAGRVYLGL